MTTTAPDPLDYFALVKEARSLAVPAGAKTLRLAVLADSSAQYLTPLLKVLFARRGVNAEIYEASFDTLKQEALTPGSALYTFKPELALVLRSTTALRAAYPGTSSGVEEFAVKTLEGLESVWAALRRHGGIQVIQGNFALPYERAFGNFEAVAGASFHAAVASLDQKLASSAARDHVLLLDVERLASDAGRSRWFDEKLWVLCKAFCAFEFLPLVAKNVADVALAARGAVKKCVVVDLDNTLWGGVVGDDGPEGIRVGHLGEGEAYLAFQRFLLELKRRGVVLAVCSRNEESVARRPFRENPEMLLKEDDFAVFIANWGNKADNVKRVAETLGIGLDSLVFLDDDAFERELVRRSHPAVAVPELPADAADYVKAVCALNLFETASFTAEDRARADAYRAQAKRSAAQETFTSTEDYLRSLKMEIELKRFDAFSLPRVAQLIGRSNQFNLTTKRYTEPECAAFMKDDGVLPLCASLKDDLGDSGLIAVAILRRTGKVLEIDSWLMSCRVLLRGVEEFMMNSVAAYAQKNGFEKVIGTYLPTEKNGLVKDFYARFGFRKTGDAPGGGSVWELKPGAYAPKPVFFARTVAP